MKESHAEETEIRRPTLDGISEAAALLEKHAPPTPLVRPPLLRKYGDLWVKNETVSPVASFKWRGALTAVTRSAASTAVVTSSTGNHGQGVAWAAAVRGIRAHIFLPSNPNPVKRDKIAGLGAEIHEVGHDLDAAKETALAWARDHGYLFIDDGESVDVIEGAGTVGLEIARQISGVDHVVVPMGSGSLAAGVAIAVKASHPRARVIAVQAKGSPAMVESFHARRAIEKPADTIADGLICRVPAELALTTLLEYVDDAITVTEEEILASMRRMALRAHILAEPAGAAALAGANRLALEGSVVVIASGSNASEATLLRALSL